MLVRECRVVKTHQHSAQGRSVQASSNPASSFVTALLSHHLHVAHRHSNSGFPYLVSQREPRPWRCWIMLICCGNQWMERSRHSVMSLSRKMRDSPFNMINFCSSYFSYDNNSVWLEHSVVIMRTRVQITSFFFLGCKIIKSICFCCQWKHDLAEKVFIWIRILTEPLFPFVYFTIMSPG